VLSLQDVIEKVAGLPQVHGSDFTDALGILLWEPAISAQLVGQQRGNFPYFIPKTDQERIQNISEYEYQTLKELDWEVTEKLDGSSMTIYNYKDVYGVCSRNIELKMEDTNTFSNMARILPIVPPGFAVQGELVGPGIQGNQYGLANYGFYVFDIYDIINERYLLPAERYKISVDCGFNHVPVLGHCKLVTSEKMLETANGISKLNNSKREGVVCKAMNSDKSFKVISNEWLCENE